MVQLSEQPFREWIVPNPGNAHVYTGMPPPQYDRSPGFAFPLNSIVRDGCLPFVVQAIASPKDMSLIDEVHRQIGLDRGQCQALIAALTQEFAPIGIP
ncbi:MAG: hypothetical protein MMC33_007460 [Icmadophila ericetorum]|nr:hypothetical protein [Icmadophila ericetorum]